MRTTTRRGAAVLTGALISVAALVATAVPASAAAPSAACGNGNNECYVHDSDGIVALRVFAGWNTLVASVQGNGGSDQTVTYGGNAQATHVQVLDKLGNKPIFRVRTIFPQ